jgi:hypothetical protein
VSTTIKILLDLDDHFISKQEVLSMAEAISDAYPDEGTYVTSFGFLCYTIKRRVDSCVVEVTEGYGYHSAWGGVDGNFC